MYDEFTKCMGKKSSKKILSFVMITVLILSSMSFNNLAYAAPRGYYITGVNINGNSQIELGTEEQKDGYSEKLREKSELEEGYQNVPMNVTFEIGNNLGNVFLDRNIYDPETGKMSTKGIINRDLFQIREVKDGKNFEDVKVSCKNDEGIDPEVKFGDNEWDTIKVRTTKLLKPNTNYELVVKKYLTKTNEGGRLFGTTYEDVIIPFKTVDLDKSTLSKATLDGSTLRLEGLPKYEDMMYNFSSDGEFDEKNWKAFKNTDTAYNIKDFDLEVTENSKIKVAYEIDQGIPSMESEAVGVTIVSSEEAQGAPSFAGANLYGKELTLNGLPSNATNLEYRVLVDDESSSNWAPLEVLGTASVVNIEDMNLYQGKSKLQVRYKGSDKNQVAERSFYYTIGEKGTTPVEVPLIKGEDTLMTEGVKIHSEALSKQETNTVTVRKAEGEKIPTIITNKGFALANDSYLEKSGGVYGFNFKNAGDSQGNKVKITIPFNIPSTVKSSQVAIYKLIEFEQDDGRTVYQRWRLMPTIIDEQNGTATVEIKDEDLYKARNKLSVEGYEGKDIVLAVKNDVTSPSGIQVNSNGRTDKSYNLKLHCGDWSGISEYKLKRVTRYTNDEKIVTIDATSEVDQIIKCEIDYKNGYKGLSLDGDTSIVRSSQDPGQSVFYTDRDVKPDEKYDYTIISVTDRLGNETSGEKLATTDGTIDSMEKLVNEIKNSILEGLDVTGKDSSYDSDGYYQPRISFRGDDNKNSVTSNIYLPSIGKIFGNAAPYIVWTSDNSEVIDIYNHSDKSGNKEYAGTGLMKSNSLAEIKLPVDSKGNPTEAKVNLTGKITRVWNDSITNEKEEYVGTVEVPLIVKWDIKDKKVNINTELEGTQVLNKEGSKIEYAYENNPLNEIIKASKFDNSIVDTIVAKDTIAFNYDNKASKTYTSRKVEIDLKGKTIQKDFNGVLFRELQQHGGSFTLKNGIIDMNHKSGTVFDSWFDTELNLENVKIINSENCDYGFKIRATVATYPTKFTAKNCEFNSFKIAAVVGQTSEYTVTWKDSSGVERTREVPYTSIDINNCKFNGQGNPGYGVLGAFSDISIKNTAFKGYKGNVVIGENGSNDPSIVDEYVYKGVPNGSSSAAVLVKELALVNMKNNTISDCDNSILVWTGEKDFTFLLDIVRPSEGFVTYPTINGIKVNDSTANEVMDKLLGNNTIKAEGNKNNVVIQDASDRYNPKTILSKASGSTTTPPVVTPPSDKPSEEEPPVVTPPVVTPPVDKEEVIVPGGIGGKTEEAIKAEVVRETDEKGNKIDKVDLNQSKIKEIIAKAAESKTNNVAVLIPYTKDNNAEIVKVKISKESLKELENNKIGLNLISEKGEVNISKETIKSLKNEDINISIGEVKDNKSILETKAVIESLHKDAKILSTPLKIKTKITSENSPIEVVIPLKKGDFNPKNLAVVVEHSDNTKETLKGEAIYSKKGEVLGIKIKVKKFSTFTVVEIDEKLTLSESNITKVRLPLDVKMQGSEIVGQVENKVTKKIVYVNVNPKATWKLYKDEACTEEIKNKTMKLNVGTNKAYIKVTSDDGKTSKVYTVKINRSEK